MKSRRSHGEIIKPLAIVPGACIMRVQVHVQTTGLSITFISISLI